MRRSPTPRILYIDDSGGGAFISTLKHFGDCDYCVSTVGTPNEALELIAGEPFDHFILKYCLAEMSGVELCRRIRQTDKKTPILFCGGRTRLADCDVSLAAGATEYLVEPVGAEYLIETVRRLLSDFHASKPNQQAACCLTK